MVSVSIGTHGGPLAAIVHNLPLCSGLLETGLTTGHPTPIFSVGEVCFKIADLASLPTCYYATMSTCGHCPWGCVVKHGALLLGAPLAVGCDMGLCCLGFDCWLVVVLWLGSGVCVKGTPWDLLVCVFSTVFKISRSKSGLVRVCGQTR